jgi:LPXTG-site transpeptidase (sortase) family protein
MFDDLNNLTVPIIEGQINDEGEWLLPVGKKAAHLETSAQPGQDGNIVIYGHNKAGVLSELKQVAIGDRITVRDETGQIYHYRVVRREVVQPNETELVQPQEQEILTIYTCTGWWDRQRLIVQAVPIYD